MKISDGEKIMLLMLCELYDKLDVDGEIEPDFIRSAIFSEHTWALPWKYPGIPFEDQETPQVVQEVLDILDMWSFIERSYAELSDGDKKSVEEKAAPFGKDPTFRGFDGNNETDYMSAAYFVVNDLDRFAEFKGRDLNSHAPSLESYKRMLTAYEQICRDANFRSLGADELIAVLKERTHPSNR